MLYIYILYEVCKVEFVVCLCNLTHYSFFFLLLFFFCSVIFFPELLDLVSGFFPLKELQLLVYGILNDK